MTRIVEPDPFKSELPDYKSPSSRIVKSLRKAYDNARVRIVKKSDQILALQGKIRDVENSRNKWKERFANTEAELLRLKKENELLKKNLM